MEVENDDGRAGLILPELRVVVGLVLGRSLDWAAVERAAQRAYAGPPDV